MGYRLLASAIVVVHFAFLLYVIFGGFLAWRWRNAIWPHFAAAGWGAGIALGLLECPLTAAENWARAQAGEAAAQAGFIDRFVEGVLYPERYTTLLQALGALVVAASWLGARRAARRRRTVSRTSAISRDGASRA